MHVLIGGAVNSVNLSALCELTILGPRRGERVLRVVHLQGAIQGSRRPSHIAYFQSLFCVEDVTGPAVVTLRLYHPTPLSSLGPKSGST